jgi:hypothetical protein
MFPKGKLAEASLAFNPGKGRKMILLLIWIGVVVFAFQGFFTGFGKPDSLGSYFFVGLFYLFICGVAGMVCADVAAGIGQFFEGHAVEGEHSRLLAIRDKDGGEGSFFLGSGFISSQPYYFYYEQLKNGGFRPRKIEADDGVTVYEEDRKDAELVTFHWKINYPSWAWIFCMPDSDGSQKETYAFHVPRGTIKTGYSM